jgi:hypothetical protein
VQKCKVGVSLAQKAISCADNVTTFRFVVKARW